MERRFDDGLPRPEGAGLIGALDPYPPLRLPGFRPYAVAEGGLALVYLCTRDAEPSAVAVKRLRPEVAAEPGASDAFMRECHLWLLLGGHPNVTTVIAAQHVPPELPVAIVERLDHSVRVELQEGPIDPVRAVQIAADIAAGMIHAAEVLPGFVHADLKPENVLIGADGRAQVSDFGFSRVAQHGPAPQSSAPAAGSTAAGTPPYMAPEQVLGLEPAPAADAYAFGATLHEMLTGQLLFSGVSTAGGFHEAHLRRPPDLFPAGSDHLPDALTGLVRACVEKDPGDRPESFDVIREALAGAAASLGPPLPPLKPAVVAPVDRLRAANALVSLGFNDDAITAAAGAETSGDPVLQVFLLLTVARAHRQAGDRTAAAAALDQASSHLEAAASPSAASAYETERGSLAMEGRDHQVALQHFTRSVALTPDAGTSWWNCAVAMEALGQDDLALNAIEEAVGRSGDLRYLDALVIRLIEHGDLRRAAAFVEATLQQHPTAPGAHALAARMHLVLAEELPEHRTKQLRLARASLETAAELGLGSGSVEELAAWSNRLASSDP